MIKFRLECPKPNLKWYKDGKKEYLKVVEEHNKKSWAAAKDPGGGGKWAPRKPPTGQHPLLRKSGKMFGSTKFKAGDRPFDFKATVGVKYGKYHQEGTSKMPRRRWLGIDHTIDDQLMPVVKKHIFKGKYVFK